MVIYNNQMVTCKKQNKFMTITSTDFKSGRVISLWVGKCNVRYKQTNIIFQHTEKWPSNRIKRMFLKYFSLSVNKLFNFERWTSSHLGFYFTFCLGLLVDFIYNNQMVTCKKQNKFMTITSTDFKSGRVIKL
jgi:hypothetical protein